MHDVQGGDDRAIFDGDLDACLRLEAFGTADGAVGAHVDDVFLIGIDAGPYDVQGSVRMRFAHEVRRRLRRPRW